MYVSEAWQALCCCKALWVKCCISRKHGRPSFVAGHCGLSAVHLKSMAGPLLLQGLLSPLSKMVLSIVSAVGMESVESMVCPIQDLQ